MSASPLTVNVYRGDTVESSHLVHAVVMDRDGNVQESWGNMDRPVSPRSSLKPLQALPLLESGAADAFGLGGREIALACASHNAEPVHTDAVAAWLETIGLTKDVLACGGHLSISKTRAHEMIRAGETLTGLHSDCSGKHAGMLSTAVHMGEPVENYVDPAHPVQRRIYLTISEMAEYDLSKGHSGTDGCSAPNPAIPLKNLALAFSRFMAPERLSPERATACARILDAMAAHPYMIGGMERFDTLLIEASQGNIVCKIGAEGNYVAFIRDRGLALYLKAEDGVSERATVPVLGALLNRYKAIDKAMDARIEKATRPVLTNWTGREIGRITVMGL